MKKWIKVMLVKWYIGQCPHICLLCKYRKTEHESCMEEMYNSDLQFLKLTKKDYKNSLKKN